ncbi:MAG: VOC family protein [Phycisphaerales bacterium]
MSHAPAAPATRIVGAFCWNELHTGDPARAAAFYAAVIPWKTDGDGTGPYTEFVDAKGNHNGGMMQLHAGASKEGRAAWHVYVNVDDVDAAAARVPALGGRVLAPPTDYPHVGRVCPVADPTGAVVHLFRGIEQCGIRVPQEHDGTFCWMELLTRDTAACARFYGALLGWKTTEMPMPGFTYTLFWLRDADPASRSGCQGGMMEIQPDMGPMPPHWLPYIAVADVDAAAARAAEHGGKICAPPWDIPGVGRMAVVTDPTGATFALFKAKQQ